MQYRLACLAAALILVCAGPARADQPALRLHDQAASLANRLASACPMTGYGDIAGFQACVRALKDLELPFGPSVGWGGDQPEKTVKKKTLTQFNSRIFQSLYMPLFTFTGRWALDEDKLSRAPIIRVEAFFRNTLPPGEYPYPFWHSAAKWSAYEAVNEIRFYIDQNEWAFIVTRDSVGSEDRRGPYAKAVTPAFDGAWQWHDPAGDPQPRVALFSARYGHDNPYLSEVDKTYRSFALRMRDQSCLDCHTPANRSEASRLVLLQTPLHAAGEIDRVIRAIKAGEMPQDDIGLRKEIPDTERIAVLDAALAFRDQLRLADGWELSRVP
jgi:hypothetical protein